MKLFIMYALTLLMLSAIAAVAQSTVSTATINGVRSVSAIGVDQSDTPDLAIATALTHATNELSVNTHVCLCIDPFTDTITSANVVPVYESHVVEYMAIVVVKRECIR